MNAQKSKDKLFIIMISAITSTIRKDDNINNSYTKNESKRLSESSMDSDIIANAESDITVLLTAASAAVKTTVDDRCLR